MTSKSQMEINPDMFDHPAIFQDVVDGKLKLTRDWIVSHKLEVIEMQRYFRCRFQHSILAPKDMSTANKTLISSMFEDIKDDPVSVAYVLCVFFDKEHSWYIERIPEVDNIIRNTVSHPHPSVDSYKATDLNDELRKFLASL